MNGENQAIYTAIVARSSYKIGNKVWSGTKLGIMQRLLDLSNTLWHIRKFWSYLVPLKFDGISFLRRNLIG